MWQQQYGSTNYTTSSPAIDPNRQFVYTYGLDLHVHKLRVVDGGEVQGSGWPELATRKPNVEQSSSALSISTLASGTSYLYVANGGYPGDAGDYQGHLTTINLATGGQHVFNTLFSTETDVHFVENASPDCGQVQSAIWARAGVVYDSVNDRVYIATGNGDYNPGNHDWGDSVIALTADGTGNSGVPLDSYTPTNYASLQTSDTDLGSTAPAILPTPSNSNVQHRAVQGGKDAKLRLLNLDNFSGRGGPGYTGGEVAAVINVPQGGEVLTAPAVWANPTDNSTWVIVANDNGISGLRLTVDGSVNPSLKTQWTRTVPGASPLIANSILYYAHSNAIQALNPLNGALVWQNTSIGGIHWHSPVVANGTLYIEDNSVHMTAFSVPVRTATITASPNPVPSSSNTTTISWNTGDGSTGQVDVSVNGGSESLFAQGSCGTATAPWISSGSTYVFNLHAGTSHTTVLATTTVTRSSASLSANPNPVPAGSGVGTTTISWNTGDGSSGQVYVSQNGGSDALFTQGSSGSATAPWINAGSTYVFSLYAGTGHTAKLASVAVTHASAPRVTEQKWAISVQNR